MILVIFYINCVTIFLSSFIIMSHIQLFNNSGKALFVLYLMIAGNYLGNIFRNDIVDIMNKNKFIIHLVSFMTIYFFILMMDTTNLHPITKLGFAFAIYALFYMSTRINKTLWIYFMILLSFFYILFTVKDSINMDLVKHNIEYTQSFILLVIIVLLFIGYIVAT